MGEAEDGGEQADQRVVGVGTAGEQQLEDEITRRLEIEGAHVAYSARGVAICVLANASPSR